MKKQYLKRFLPFAIVAIGMASCTENTEFNKENVPDPESIRVLIANEGNYGRGTASLTAITYAGEVKNDIFQSVNNRPLGDVAQGMALIKGNYYVTLNNSRKIEVMDAKSFLSVETIETPDRSIPCYITHLGGDSAAVSEKGTGRLMIMNLNHSDAQRKKVRLIENVGTTTHMILKNKKLFLAGGGRIRVFSLGNMNNASQMREIKDNGSSIGATGDSKIVLDKNGHLWTLARVSNQQKLVRIDTETEQVLKSYPIEGLSISSFGVRLDVSPKGDKVYFTAGKDNKQGIICMPIDAATIPTDFLFTYNDKIQTLYNMSVSPEGTFFICDALNYSSRGKVYEYKASGDTIRTVQSGIIPQYILFLK